MAQGQAQADGGAHLVDHPVDGPRRQVADEAPHAGMSPQGLVELQQVALGGPVSIDAFDELQEGGQVVGCDGRPREQAGVSSRLSGRRVQHSQPGHDSGDIERGFSIGHVSPLSDAFPFGVVVEVVAGGEETGSEERVDEIGDGCGGSVHLSGQGTLSGMARDRCPTGGGAQGILGGSGFGERPSAHEDFLDSMAVADRAIVVAASNLNHPAHARRPPGALGQ
jgi:hypothetical protein